MRTLNKLHGPMYYKQVLHVYTVDTRASL